MNDPHPRRFIVLLAAFAFFLGYACFFLAPGVFVPWNNQLMDHFFVLRNNGLSTRPAYDSTIVHVNITNRTIQQIPRLTRAHDAEVVRALHRLNVAAQLHDYIYPNRSDSTADQMLIDAVSKAPHVYFGLAFERLADTSSALSNPIPSDRMAYVDQTEWTIETASKTPSLVVASGPFTTFPELAKASSGLGFLNTRPDQDGVFRRALLLVRYGESYYPSLVFRAICDYLKVTPDRIRLASDRIVLQAVSRGKGYPLHDIVIPIDSNGRMIINFIGPWTRMAHYDYFDVLESGSERFLMNMWREELAGKIVVISNVATGTTDIGPVPGDADFPLVGLIANTMHTILTEDFLRAASTTEMILIEVGLMGLILMLAFRVSPVPFILCAISIMVSYAGIAYVLFLYSHLLVNLLRPVIMISSSLGMVVLHRYITEGKERAVLRNTFEAYFPPTVIDRIMDDPQLVIASAGRRKTLTMMFTDIVGFSTYSAHHEPAHIQSLLNEYFESMIDIVFRYGGTIEKFTGDGFLVFFGDPDEQPDHALRCVHSAIDMQLAARKLRTAWEARGHMPIQIRIGINTGPVVVGNMGSARRLTYTVIGSAANLAQRMEANAPAGGILITRATMDALGDQIPVTPRGAMTVKGFEEQVEIYEVVVEKTVE